MCQNLDLRFLLFIAFLSSLFATPFRFFDLASYCLFSFFDLVFYRPLFFLFSLLFFSFFLVYVVSSLAYPTLFGNKKLGCWLDCSEHEVVKLSWKLSARMFKSKFLLSQQHMR
jgi:hypothetical protein